VRQASNRRAHGRTPGVHSGSSNTTITGLGSRQPKMSRTSRCSSRSTDAGNMTDTACRGACLAYPSIGSLKTQIDAASRSPGGFSITEGDIRSDFEPNPGPTTRRSLRPVTAADGRDPAAPGRPSAHVRRPARGGDGTRSTLCNSRCADPGLGQRPTIAWPQPAIMTKQADSRRLDGPAAVVQGQDRHR